MTIPPSIGAIVWFWQDGEKCGEQPEAAMITRIHSCRQVNVLVTSHDGLQHAEHRITLVQPGDIVPYEKCVMWTPQQIAGAKP